jgi:hypothetical protein
MRKGRNVHGILMGMREGKCPLGIPRLKEGDNSYRDIKEIVWAVMDWFYTDKKRD